MPVTSLAMDVAEPVAVVALIWTLYLLGGYFRDRSRRARSPETAALWDLLSSVDQVALRVVESLEQTVVRPAKAAGAWTPQLAADTKAKAVKDVTNVLLGSRVAAPAGGALDSVVAHTVEMLVRRIREGKPAASSAPTGRPA